MGARVHVALPSLPCRPVVLTAAGALKAGARNTNPDVLGLPVGDAAARGLPERRARGLRREQRVHEQGGCGVQPPRGEPDARVQWVG